MRKVLTAAIIGFIFFVSISTNVLPCGMMKRGIVSGGMMCQNPMSQERLNTGFMESGDMASDGDPSKLIKAKCSLCHNPQVIFFSRKSDWSQTVHKMNNYHLLAMNMPLLSDGEREAIVHYLNTYYSVSY